MVLGALHPTLNRMVLLAVVPLTTGCASHSSMKIGSSTNANAGDRSEELASDAPKSASPKAPQEEPVSTPASAPSDLDPPPQPREAQLARVALRKSNSMENHLGLKIAISERTSDLPWVIAIENSSDNRVELVAMPQLLSFQVTKPKTEEELANEKLPKWKRKKPRGPTVCGLDNPPGSVDPQDRIHLEPGQLIFHSFDPRALCAKEDALVEGAEIRLTYGFPVEKKKAWRQGKLVEVDKEQKAPFVAKRVRENDEEPELVPLKNLEAETFVLGRTYPLSNVSAKLAQDDGTESSKPQPPLRVEISPLGTKKKPATGLVDVRIHNVSKDSVNVFLRRELISYEVAGPSGTSSCQMQPTDRSPDRTQFIAIKPGSSTRLQTRLAEACPPGTWDTPGTYMVSARFTAHATDRGRGIQAYVGSVTSQRPARLVVPGKKNAKSEMRIVASALNSK